MHKTPAIRQQSILFLTKYITYYRHDPKYTVTSRQELAVLKDTFRDLLNSSEKETRDQMVQLVVLLKSVYKE